jgi:hypothetical protein
MYKKSDNNRFMIFRVEDPIILNFSFLKKELRKRGNVYERERG